MLELKNVGKVFNPGTVNEKKALTAVNLHLAEGDFATIVGSNGAGKSTLFNAIAGAFTPDTGSITLAGQDITFLPDYRRSKFIGRMFQDPLKGTARKISRWRFCAPRGRPRRFRASPKPTAPFLPSASPRSASGWRTA